MCRLQLFKTWRVTIGSCIFVGGVRTIREGVLIEEGTLTEVVRYMMIWVRSLFKVLCSLPKEKKVSVLQVRQNTCSFRAQDKAIQVCKIHKIVLQLSSLELKGGVRGL